MWLWGCVVMLTEGKQIYLIVFFLEFLKVYGVWFSWEQVCKTIIMITGGNDDSNDVFDDYDDEKDDDYEKVASSGVNSSAASISLLVSVPSPFTSILMKALWNKRQSGNDQKISTKSVISKIKAKVVQLKKGNFLWRENNLYKKTDLCVFNLASQIAFVDAMIGANCPLFTQKMPALLYCARCWEFVCFHLNVRGRAHLVLANSWTLRSLYLLWEEDDSILWGKRPGKGLQLHSGCLCHSAPPEFGELVFLPFCFLEPKIYMWRQ